MIKKKQQRFFCVQTKDLFMGHVEKDVYYNAVRESEDEYTITDQEGKGEFKAGREELLSCGYLC